MIEEEKIKYKGIKGVPVIRKPGSAVKVHTGTWRTKKPVIDRKKCIKCKTCWLYCPEAAIKWKGKPKIDYHICKGCGICAQECPVKAIKMIKEKK